MPKYLITYVGAYTHGDSLMKYMRGEDIPKKEYDKDDDEWIEASNAVEALEKSSIASTNRGDLYHEMADIDFEADFSEGHEGWCAINERLFGCLKKEMTLQEFQDQIQNIRASNGWRIEIEFVEAFIVRVFDKETGKKLASTGSTHLGIIPLILQIPFDKPPWTSV